MANDAPTLEARSRDDLGSRNTRRKRREGIVPGVVYGGGGEPVALQVDEAELRVALGSHSALIDLKIDGKGEPVLVREQQRHPVTGRITHIDLLRVDLTKKVQAQVPLSVQGGEDSPGVRFGGLLEQVVRELTIEALPTAIPELLTADASTMEIGDTLAVDAVTAPEGVEILTDPDEVIATLAASRMSQQTEREGEEGETEVVGEAAAAEEAAEAGESGGDEAEAEAGGEE